MRLLTTDLWASSKHQKIIYIVRLHEIVLIDQRKPGACSFFDYDFLVESVVVALTVAIDNAEQGTAPHGLASSFQQADRLSNFVIGFQQQNRIHALRGQ